MRKAQSRRHGWGQPLSVLLFLRGIGPAVGFRIAGIAVQKTLRRFALV